MSKNKRDYYDILQISKNASEAEIKKAYRSLAKKYHPDIYKEKDADIKMREINEAYEILSDPEKKQMYDQYGHTDNNMFGGNQGFGNFEDIFGGFGSAFGDIFGDLFGGRRQQQQHSHKGEDIHYRETITLKEAILGKTLKFTTNVNTPCKECNQTGAKSASDIVTCPNCNGSGQETTQIRTMLGTIRQQQVCSQCKGNGKIIKIKCSKCHGKKLNVEKETVQVDIPKGIFTGQAIRLQEKGHFGINNQSRGDLFIEITVKAHPYVQRDNLDLIVSVPISFIDAMMGAKIIVPTFEGQEDLKIPARTKNNEIFIIRNKGSFDLRNPNKRGNLKVKVEITFPKKLTKTQETLLSQLRDDLNFKPDEEFNRTF